MSRKEVANVKLINNSSGVLIVAIDTSCLGSTRDTLRAINTLIRRNRLTPPDARVAQALHWLETHAGASYYKASRAIAGDYSLVRAIRYWVEKERRINHTKQVNGQEAEMKGENDGQSHVA